MPAGAVKTPNTARAKDANATKSADRNGSTGSGGKKFVQTRLPFKLIAPLAKGGAADAAATKAAASTSSAVELDLDLEEAEPRAEPRKRKLSYGSESPPETEQLRRSNSKENLQLFAAATATYKKPKTTEANADDVIELDDDEHEDNDNDKDNNNDEKKDSAKKEEDRQAKGNVKEKKLKEKPTDGATHTPIQIKLPLGNKRVKRRKSLKKSEAAQQSPQPKLGSSAERSDSSDDIEAIAESLNPQKRAKVIEVESMASPKTSKTSKPNGAKADTRVQVKASTASAKSKKEGKSKEQAKVEPKAVEDEDVVLLDSSAELEAEEAEPEAEAEAVVKQPSQPSADMDVDVDTDTLITSPEKEQNTKQEESSETEKETEEEGKSASAAPVVAEKLPNLTPKQQRLMEQRRKAREEKERKLQEERRLKQLEKEQREQQRKAERDLKEEQRRKEREDKEEARRKEREEKERKRQAENEEKERKRQAENEEKRKRNEAKEEIQRKKDEERRRKEQEKEEAELKKKRAAATFSKFFVPKQPRQSISGSLEHEQNSSDCDPSHMGNQQLAFRPFQVKDDMIVAPVTRTTLAADTRQLLDTLFHVPDDDEEDGQDLNESIGRTKRPTRAHLYLNELSQGKRKPLASKRDARLQRCAKDEEDDDDVQVVDDLVNAVGTPIVVERPKQVPWMRAKYLHFADNRRPPYYGTWRKRSQVITARRPLGQDKAYFDYEVDSDCEWEEEEPGESLSASEDEKERESEEESEEEYNEWFVPHGHLSDEELQNDGELEDGNTREAQKAKLQVLQQEFAQEMKKQTKKIKPRLLGPVWLDEDGNKSQLCPAVFIQTIDMYGCWQLQPLTLEPPQESGEEEEPLEEAKAKPATLQLDEQLLQQLVRLIHGNSNAKMFLIAEYLEYLKTQITPESQTMLPSKTMLREKFDELATWKPVEKSVGAEAKKSKKPKKRLCWVVAAETLHRFHLDELTLQNQWNYTLTPKVSKADTSLPEASLAVEAADAPGTPKTDADKAGKAKDSAASTPTASTGTPSTAATRASSVKKRVNLLMSVPRDQQFHAATKNALISQYLRKSDDPPTKQKPSPAPPPGGCSDDVVLLSD
ncbi:PREDICTED: chromatin assembly factor 1 subunit A-B [Drosophila arizonae]|uniref:Chromatin assembly factor 1 subunit A-B n=1 Tax=Drosophila arizonae TaxID=7263 RepID=A0ABM1PQW2_DROAR|nr:PREDICTED: chromatin assembly factor 1 subunit A-B [Drosophila arizonae]